MHKNNKPLRKTTLRSTPKSKKINQIITIRKTTLSTATSSQQSESTQQTPTTESNPHLSSIVSAQNAVLPNFDEFLQSPEIQNVAIFLKSQKRPSVFTDQSTTKQNNNNNNKSPQSTPTTKTNTKLQSTPLQPMHELLTSSKPLSRKQTKTLLELGSTTDIVNDLLSKVPKQYSTCRGCGIGLQCSNEERPGYIPAPNLQSFLLRLDIQLRAAKQDLRIRSGGGKGQGTAVAALHASLKSSLAQLQREQETKHRKLGRFTTETLSKMGLDDNMNPIQRAPHIDIETGLVEEIVNPEDTPLLANLDHLNQNELKIKKKELQRMLNDPTVNADEINKLQDEINSITTKRPNIYDETQKIKKEDVLEKRDIDLLTKAAKLAAKPAKCQRCHRIGTKQYALADANPTQSIPAEDFVNLLRTEFQSEDAKSSIIIQVIDVLDFHGSIIQDLQKLTGPRNPIILAINKCDILPYDITPLHIKMWAKQEAQKYGLHVHSIFPISAATGAGVDEMMDKALVLARGNNDPTAPRNRNIYVMGSTNVGKSSLINQLLSKGVVGTGMPNDVTHLSQKIKQDNKNKGKNGITQDENIDNDPTLDPNQAQFMDTQPLDDEMELEMINTKKAERAAKKNNKTPTDEIPLQDRDDNVANILMSVKRERDRADINTVVADIDVAGVNTKALEAVLPDKYLLEHQRELQLQEAISTTSPIPGTTLGIVSFPILEKKRGGKNLQIKDTPGVLNAWQLTSHLNYSELKRVLPTKRFTPLTYRLQPGQSLFLGGLARIDMIAGKPFHVSSFVSSAISVHIGAAHRADKDYLRQQLGVNLIPPFDPEDKELNRVEKLHIYDNLANVSEAESKALETLQQISKLETQLSLDRSREKIRNQRQNENSFRHNKNKANNNNNIDDDGIGDDMNDFDNGIDFSSNNNNEHDDIHTIDPRIDRKKAYSDKNVLENIPTPKRGIDELSHRRAELREQIATALGQLAPVVSPTTLNPSRVFIDEHGRFVVQLVGEGFNTASHDIVIAGLGWISVTGSGPCTFRISVAGERADLKHWELDSIAQHHQDRADSSEIFAESNIQDHLDPQQRKYKGQISTRVRKLLSRVIIRDPLVPNMGRSGTKWTGVPELVKKQFTPAMAEQRSKIMKRNELLNLHRKNPSLHPHPDELQAREEMSHPFAGNENYENFTQHDLFNSNPLVHSKRLVELEKFERELNGIPESTTTTSSISTTKREIPKEHKLRNVYGDYDDINIDDDDDIIDHTAIADPLTLSGQRPKNDIQRDEFDAIPHPPTKHHTPEEKQLFQDKLTAKMEEKELLQEWAAIQEYHQNELKSKTFSARIHDDHDGSMHETIQQLDEFKQNDLDMLKQDLLSKRPTKQSLQSMIDINTDDKRAKKLDGRIDPLADDYESDEQSDEHIVDDLENDDDDDDGSEMDSYDADIDGSDYEYDGDDDDDDYDDDTTTEVDGEDVTAQFELPPGVTMIRENPNPNPNKVKKDKKDKKLSKRVIVSDVDGEDEELLDMDQIYGEMSDFEVIDNDIGTKKSSQSSSIPRLKRTNLDPTQLKQQLIDGGDDNDDDDGYQASDDVEYLSTMNDMPTFEEMKDLSDFDGIDYNELRRQGRLEEYLAKENDKIDKRPVPTGPQGKRETGGRRAREAMGMISQNKFEEVKKAQLAKEAKMLHQYVKNANKAARYELDEDKRQSQSTTSTKGNKGIVPKGSSNAITAGKQWDNQSYLFEEQNRMKREKTIRKQRSHDQYGPDSGSEDDPRHYTRDAKGFDYDSDDETIQQFHKTQHIRKNNKMNNFDGNKRTNNNSTRNLKYPGGEVSYDYDEESTPLQSQSPFSSNKPPKQQQSFNGGDDDDFISNTPQQHQQRGGYGGNNNNRQRDNFQDRRNDGNRDNFRGNRDNRDGFKSNFNNDRRDNDRGGFNKNREFNNDRRNDRNDRGDGGSNNKRNNDFDSFKPPGSRDEHNKGGFGFKGRNQDDRGGNFGHDKPRFNNNRNGGDRPRNNGFGGDKPRPGSFGHGGGKSHFGGNRRGFHTNALELYLQNNMLNVKM